MHRLVPWGALLFAACQSTWGSLLVRVDLAQDSKTQCVSVTLGSIQPPLVLPRQGKSLLRVAVTEREDLTGEISVAVLRFAQGDCTEPIGTALVKKATLSRNREDALSFVFRDEATEPARADGGIDGGVDAGCAPSSCATPPACRLEAVACLRPGECDYPLAPKGTSCDRGLCDELGACLAPCAVLEAGARCDDGLACTVDHCELGACVGECGGALPACHIALPACAADGGCARTAMPDDTTCALEGADGGRHQCRGGRCERTLPFAPRNLEDHVTGFPAPIGRWVLEADCRTVIDTSLSPPRPSDGGWCASIAPGTATLPLARDGGEAAVLSMESLDLPGGTEIHFVGSRPVVLVVLDDATVAGLLSAAPFMGFAPAGSSPPECLEHHLGVNALESAGGGGAASGATAGPGGGLDGGGRAGESWGGSGLLEPLRGGCAGGLSPGGGLGGIGGGAIQLTVGGRLLIAESGVVTASGGGGGGASVAGRGGGGGGSGGAVLLEASEITQLGFVTTNGGGGGEGSDLGAAGASGRDGALSSVGSAAGGASLAGGTGGSGGGVVSKGGGEGGSTSLSGGGGGGSVGRIRLRAPKMTRVAERLSGQLRVD